MQEQQQIMDSLKSEHQALDAEYSKLSAMLNNEANSETKEEADIAEMKRSINALTQQAASIK